MIFPVIIFNHHVAYTLGYPEESSPSLGSTPPLFPGVRAQVLSHHGFPLRGGGEEAGVPNDSLALQPGEVTTLQMGFKTFPGRGRWGPPTAWGTLHSSLAIGS